METLVNDIITGACCEKCNLYFAHPIKPLDLFQHGRPVVCSGCWENLNDTERAQSVKAETNLL